MLLFDAVKEKIKDLDINPKEIDMLEVCVFFKDHLSKKYNKEIPLENLSNEDYKKIKNLNVIAYENKIEFIRNYYNHTSENYSLNDLFDKIALFETIDGFINNHLNDNCSTISRHDTSIEMVFEIIED